jgi:hypothetical protein
MDGLLPAGFVAGSGWQVNLKVRPLRLAVRPLAQLGVARRVVGAESGVRSIADSNRHATGALPRFRLSVPERLARLSTAGDTYRTR